MSEASQVTVMRKDYAYAGYRNGERVTRHYAHEHEALFAVERLNRSEKVTDRDCMCCGKTFKSEGVHNRLCNLCRTKTGGMI